MRGFDRILPTALLATALYWTESQATRHLHSHSRRADSTECGLYLVSGQSTSPFQHYRFWDFRSLSNYTTQEPPQITAGEDHGDEDVTSAYFSSSPFRDAWQIKQGIKNPDSRVPMVYSARNVYLSPDESTGGGDTHLTFRTTRLEEFQSIAEMRSTDDVLHCSMRIRLKVLADDNNEVHQGAVVGYFTYESDTQESDIEILTRRPDTDVQLTNQPASSTALAARKNVTLPNGKTWTEWTDYRLDWFSDRTVWYIDGNQSFQSNNSVPYQPSAVILNLWSNGGTFSGTMRVGAEVRIAVQWIEMVYNTSNSQSNGSIATLCNVDGVATKGQPEEAGAVRIAASMALAIVTCTLAIHLSPI